MFLRMLLLNEGVGKLEPNVRSRERLVAQLADVKP